MTKTEENNEGWPSFWSWLIQSGYKHIFTKFLYLDLIISFLFFLFFSNGISAIAAGVSDILAIIFLGLAIASGSTSLACIISEEITSMYIKQGGLQDLLFPLFIPILIIPVPIIVWSFWYILDETYLFTIPYINFEIYLEYFLCFFLIAITSMSIRLAWQSYMAPAHLIYALFKIRESRANKKKKGNK